MFSKLVVACAIVSCAFTNVAAEVIRGGPKTCKGIALTFDLCPVREGSGYDEALIELLIEQRIPATFFLSGRWMTKHEPQVKQLLAVPFFEIGTHGQVHAHLAELDEDRQQREIEQAVMLLRTRYHHDAPLFRPPYGEYNETTAKIVERLGLQFILWNVVSGDPDPHLTAQQILHSVTAGIRNGTIIVFHANGKGRHTHEVVETLVREAIPSRGLHPMTVTELLTCTPHAHQ